MRALCLVLVTLCAVTVPTVTDAHSGEGDIEHPNFIFILVDDLGYGDLGFTGAAWSTPAIDALKSDSLFLDRYYVDPYCTPTRSAFMTGRYPHRDGIQNVFLVGSNATVPMDKILLPQKLKPTYQNYLVGKWHLGYLDWANAPHHRGFDDWIGIFQGETYQYKHLLLQWDPCNVTGPMVLGRDFWNNSQNYETSNVQGDEQSYAEYIYRMKALDIIEKHGEEDSEPFFLMLSEQTIHAPFEDPPTVYPECEFPDVPEVENATSYMKEYCGMIKYVDDTVNQIVERLKTTGLWNTTYIIFSTDNGGIPFGYTTMFGYRPGEASNWPYRSGKSYLFEGGVRGAGFVGGGALPDELRGETSSSLFHMADWHATIVELSGTYQPYKRLEMDGVSQACVIRNDCEWGEPRNTLFLGLRPQDGFNSGTVLARRQGKLFKFLQLVPDEVSSGTVFYGFSKHRNTSDWLTETPCGDPLENPYESPFNGSMELFFDLTHDPSECTDVVDKPQLREELKALLDGQNALPPIQNVPMSDEDANCDAAPKNNGGLWSPIYGDPEGSGSLVPRREPRVWWPWGEIGRKRKKRNGKFAGVFARESTSGNGEADNGIALGWLVTIAFLSSTCLMCACWCAARGKCSRHMFGGYEPIADGDSHCVTTSRA